MDDFDPNNDFKPEMTDVRWIWRGKVTEGVSKFSRFTTLYPLDRELVDSNCNDAMQFGNQAQKICPRGSILNVARL
jgi:hypothetical protein